jgi:hypothetical protein
VFGAPDVAEEKATVDEYESGNTEEKVMSISLPHSILHSMTFHPNLQSSPHHQF